MKTISYRKPTCVVPWLPTFREAISSLHNDSRKPNKSVDDKLMDEIIWKYINTISRNSYWGQGVIGYQLYKYKNGFNHKSNQLLENVGLLTFLFGIGKERNNLDPISSFKANANYAIYNLDALGTPKATLDLIYQGIKSFPLNVQNSYSQHIARDYFNMLFLRQDILSSMNLLRRGYARISDEDFNQALASYTMYMLNKEKITCNKLSSFDEAILKSNLEIVHKAASDNKIIYTSKKVKRITNDKFIEVK